MQGRQDHDDRQQLEAAARTALELRADRKFTDLEWAAAKSKLMDFMKILRSWEQTTTGTSRDDNVEQSCDRKPRL